MNKNDKLQVLIDHQKKVIEELRTSMESYKDSSDLDEDNTLDPEDFAQQSAAKEDQYRLTEQFNNARINLELLQRYASEHFNTVQAGALIKTENQWFLAGISLKNDLVGKDENLLCVSVDSPAFEVIAGKKVGENFTLGKHTYTIKSIS